LINQSAQSNQDLEPGKSKQKEKLFGHFPFLVGTEIIGRGKILIKNISVTHLTMIGAISLKNYPNL